MIIPKLHYISEGITPADHLENIQKACTSGAELVQLNVAISSEKKFLKAVTTAREITAHFQTRLVIRNHPKIAKQVKADGVFLSDTTICPSKVRNNLFSWQSVGATATTLEECETLIGKEVDYIYLAPYRVTSITENTPKVLGLAGYTAIIDALKSETLMLGFGEITTADVPDILKTGISGIAVATAITQDFNTIRTFNVLLNASVTEEQRHTFE